MTVKISLPSRRLPAMSVPKAGKTVRLTANGIDLVQIATHLGLASCEQVIAELAVLPVRGDMLKVTGNLSARVHQTCVVSLEAFPVVVEEDIDVRFAPPEKLGPITKAEVERSLEDEDPPEPLEAGTIDLWAVAVDHLAVALDPYPRKPGIEMQPDSEPEVKESPFAALAMLKKGLEKS